MSAKRVFLIHATSVAVAPINEAFARLWPEAELCNLLEDSLSRDLRSAGTVTDALKHRFMELARYARAAGADGILFTCSAFGEAIDACKKGLDIPVLKPNEAMLEEALEYGDRVALLATFAPAIDSMSEELHQAAAARGRQVAQHHAVCTQAIEALHHGDTARHDQLISEMVSPLSDMDVICFAQFSMTSAVRACASITEIPLLTTPGSAVLKMKRLLSEG
ncbi:MAG TPA: aspartate/glutamate racemase family protein [Pseudomonas sp.]|uniref:aspartate/glutamate racemase family protein n=1 Tax=Pseudomonas sp. TaxID=306 RepID=UPI002B47A9CD|nr:aspartate/glutamate racemase family protein [Pseudomonas sp.]HKS13351.1 aspartate/glutamate racemase family protein [Pseudomonas sp.]